MKKLGRIVGLILLALVLGGIGSVFWPKYGLCPGDFGSGGRAGEIACYIRRNFHVGAHFTWVANLYTHEAVRSTLSEADIPALVELLGHSRPMVSSAAGELLSDFGEPGLEALRIASRSPDFQVRFTAKDALSTYEIMQNAPNSQP